MTYKELALKLCDGYLDMPSGCDGCPLGTENYDDDGNMICMLNDVESTIDDVPVVQCKDCVYAKFNVRCSRYWCGKNAGVLMYSNDFCSYGKRKEETNDR